MRLGKYLIPRLLPGFQSHVSKVGEEPGNKATVAH